MTPHGYTRPPRARAAMAPSTAPARGCIAAFRQGEPVDLCLVAAPGNRGGRRPRCRAAFQTARAQLAEEFDVDPGPDLAWLHEAILRADPGLEAVVAAS